MIYILLVPIKVIAISELTTAFPSWYENSWMELIIHHYVHTVYGWTAAFFQLHCPLALLWLRHLRGTFSATVYLKVINF